MSEIRDRLWQQYMRSTQSVRELQPARQGAGEVVRLPLVANVERQRETRTILVHGYKDDASIFIPLASHLSDLGLKSYSVTLAPSDCSVPLETLAQQLAAFIDDNFAAGQRLDFVGFSLGSIVTRYYIQRMGGLARTNRFLSVAAPHHGTWLAFASRLPAAIQLRPYSDFLRDLNADSERLASIQFASMWSPLDLMILPSLSSRMPVGKNLVVWTLRHQALITSPRGIRTIAEHLFAGGNNFRNPASPGFESRPALTSPTTGEGFELQGQS